MTVQLPWVLWVASAAALAVLAAHLVSVGRPPALLLPTTRFIPERQREAVTRTIALRDRLLMLLRVAAILLAGAAFAGLRVAPSRAPVATLLLLDLPRYAVDTLGWRDQMREAVAATAPLLGAVTSDGRMIEKEPAALQAFVDSVSLPLSRIDAGSLAGGLLAARRQVGALVQSADSVSLRVISPWRTDDTSDALIAARSVWPGRIAVQTGAGNELPSAPDSDVAGAADGSAPSTTDAVPRYVVRLASGTVSAADSSHATQGGVLVVWPDSTTASAPDSVFAIIARGDALVAPMQRVTHGPDSARALARFADGTPAITQATLGDGCVRWVQFVPPTGDAMISTAARGVRAALDAPCRGELPRSLAATVRDTLAADGPLASRAALQSGISRADNPFARWLLVGALFALLVEQLLRARSRGEET